MGARTKSVMEQIFAAMPLDPVRAKAMQKAKASGSGDWTRAPASVLLVEPKVELLAPSGSFASLGLACTAPHLSEERKKTASRSGVEPTIPIWSYEAGHQPNHFKNVSCLVHEDDYKDYLVLEELRFGQVGVECGNEKAWLPLTEDYLFCVAKVGEQDVAAGTSELFPLAATYDPSLVYAFLYDVHFELAVVENPDAPEVTEVERELHPVHPSVTDPKGWQTLLEAIGKFPDPESWKAPPVAAGSRQGSATPPGGGPASAARVPTIESVLLRDELWDPLPSVSAAEVGKRPTVVQRIPARVLVLVSLTPCREHDDFTPPVPYVGGVAGMARLYPQVMVKCTVPLRRIETSLRSKRPPKTTIRGGHACGCPDMGDAIGPLLVADTNRPAVPLPPVTNNNAVFVAGTNGPPHWNAVFAYYQTDAHEKFGLGTYVHLVDPGKPHRRVFGVEYEDRDASDLSVDKVANQGAFDNLHLAPKMRFPSEITRLEQKRGPETTFADLRKIDAWRTALQDVVMAPVCAHDCYHAHWRWSTQGGSSTVFGWDQHGPYRVPGAPMVPPHHAVDLELRSPYEVEVREAALARDDAPLPSDRWEVFHHPGYAYAVYTGTFPMTISQMPVEMWSGVWFMDDAGVTYRADTSIPPEQGGSWPVFYLLVRYAIANNLTGPPTIRERVRLRAPIEDVME
jgi:hypothetical protein